MEKKKWGNPSLLVIGIQQTFDDIGASGTDDGGDMGSN